MPSCQRMRTNGEGQVKWGQRAWHWLSHQLPATRLRAPYQSTLPLEGTTKIVDDVADEDTQEQEHYQQQNNSDRRCMCASEAVAGTATTAIVNLRAHHMVQAHNLHPAVLQGTRQSVSNNGGAQMSDVHLLGHIGRGEVHHSSGIGQGRGPSANPLSQHATPAVRLLTCGCIRQHKCRHSCMAGQKHPNRCCADYRLQLA